MYNIQKHLQYNAWANEKIVGFLANVDDMVLDTEIKSSFPSIRKTIMHVWDAQQIWFLRLRGESISGWPSQEFTGDTKELFSAFIESSHAFVNFIASKDKDYLEGKVSYKNMKGTDFSNPVDVILFHVVNHGTFHRGQILTMLRELGFTSFESQDLIAYYRLENQV
jgi:uncharacterized damage-inducible protein DinB